VDKTSDVDSFELSANQSIKSVAKADCNFYVVDEINEDDEEVASSRKGEKHGGTESYY
jgi:hypothetical protein